jgi:hypothetical protein
MGLVRLDVDCSKIVRYLLLASGVLAFIYSFSIGYIFEGLVPPISF